MSNQGLGPTQRAVLGVLEKWRSGRPAFIAEQIGKSPSAAAGALHRLEARGLVETVDEHMKGAPAIWVRT